jgi:hypothetical protein
MLVDKGAIGHVPQAEYEEMYRNHETSHAEPVVLTQASLR